MTVFHFDNRLFILIEELFQLIRYRDRSLFGDSVIIGILIHFSARTDYDIRNSVNVVYHEVTHKPQAYRAYDYQ